MTPLSTPDPALVAIPEPQLKFTTLRTGDEQDSAIEAAIQSFGRTIGQAAIADQQALEERCRSLRAAATTRSDRLAWAATCQYTRH